LERELAKAKARNERLTDYYECKMNPSERVSRMEAECDTLRAEVERLVDALRPFAHDDLQSELGGNVQGDSSPVYGRNRATLTLGDFRKARAAIDAARTP
jgi:hypothetical protein